MEEWIFSRQRQADHRDRPRSMWKYDRTTLQSVAYFSPAIRAGLGRFAYTILHKYV